MNVLFMCGSHPRHLFVANKLYETGFLKGLIVERREKFIPNPPNNIDDEMKEIFTRHFLDRSECENRHFGNIKPDDINTEKLMVGINEINNSKVINFIKMLKPDAVISYGVHILNNESLNVMPKIKWNIHGGLSPWFKGNITMFWPFYLLKPNFTGTTIHELTNKIDAGGIIHQSVPKLEYGDKIHDVACKAVVQTALDLQKILNLINNGLEITPVKQKGNGKLWIATDWTPEHLRVIYKLYDNKIVDMFLDGKFGIIEPNLIKVF